jgi:hypothetical protein
MTRISLTILVLVGCLISKAQTRYALRQIDFQDPVNSELVKSSTDNLAVILADAYLTGKLTAYKVGPLDSLIASLESPKRSVRDAMASARKKRAERKHLFSKSKGTIDLTLADLKPLTKAEFLHQMVIIEDETTVWNKTTRYKRGEGLVFHKGLGYFPKKDTSGIAPPNKIYWELAYNGNLPFYFRIPSLPAVSIFGQYVEENKKQTWQPLLIRITRTAEVPDYLVDMSVSFKYEEVMKYLAGIGQPLIYKSPYGYTGNGVFVLGDEERKNLTDQIRAQSSSNETFKANIAAPSMVILGSFLDPGNKKDEFSLFQEPSAKEFRIFLQNLPVATIPTGAVEQMLSFPKTELITYSHALSTDMFSKYEIALHGLNSVLPYQEVPETDAHPNIRPCVFLEKYTISTVGAAEQKRLRSRFTNLIKFVNTQFKEGTLLLAEEKNSYFRARFDWSTIPEVKAKGATINKAYWSNLLHHDDISDVRYPYYWSDNANVSYLHKKIAPLRVDSLEFGVTYKRTVPLAGGKASFEPAQVSLKSMQKPGPDTDNPVYTFNWIDLKKAVTKGKDPLLVELVKLIETGSLPYTDSRIVYGVIEEGMVKKDVAAKK